MGHWEGGEGQDVGYGVRQHLGSLGEVFLQLSDHPVGLGVDLFRGELLVDSTDKAAAPGWDRLGTLLSRLAMK